MVGLLNAFTMLNLYFNQARGWKWPIWALFFFGGRMTNRGYLFAYSLSLTTFIVAFLFLPSVGQVLILLAYLWFSTAVAHKRLKGTAWDDRKPPSKNIFELLFKSNDSFITLAGAAFAPPVAIYIAFLKTQDSQQLLRDEGVKSNWENDL